MERHHVLPQEHRAWFKERGFVGEHDIDRYCIELPELTMTNAWRGDWHTRVRERVREHGFDTVTAFADSRPTASLLELTRQIVRDRDIAASQIEWALIDEADESGTIERCARSLLVRRLHEEPPEGWHTEWDDPTRMGMDGTSAYSRRLASGRPG